MNPRAFFVCSVLAITAGVLAQDQSRPLPPDAVARVNDRIVAKGDYYSWLVANHGFKFLDDYVSHVLLLQIAEELGLSVTPDELDRALERHWADQALLSGGEQRFLDELQKVGLDKQLRLKMDRPRVEAQTLASKIVRAQRNPTEADLLHLHTSLFGENAVRTHLKVAHFSKHRGMRPGDQPGKAEVERMDRDALERASKFAAEVSADPSRFSELVAATDPAIIPRNDSMLRDLRESGGDLPIYRKEYFYGALEDSLEEAELDAVIGPIKAASGYYVALLVLRENAPFAEVKAEVEGIFRTRPATAQEIYEMQKAVREAAKIEKAPMLPPL